LLSLFSERNMVQFLNLDYSESKSFDSPHFDECITLVAIKSVWLGNFEAV